VRLLQYRDDGVLAAAIALGPEGDAFDAGALAAAAGHAPGPWTTRSLLEAGSEVLADLGQAAREAAVPSLGPVDGLELGPPLHDPDKFICLGLNYYDHAEEIGMPAPSVPMLFAKFRNSLAGPYDDVVIPAVAGEIDYEAELAVVIGRRGREIEAGDALEHVAGAMALNDVSARDLQMATSQWLAGKAIDGFAPCGPALVLRDELGDLQDLGIETRVNGATVQAARTSKMIHSIAATIAFVSSLMTLEVGDVIATGTPAGVGVSRQPQLLLSDGDQVEIEIEALGVLRNRFVDAAAVVA
jgi:2-keto-4-pentenoate hydratase/2-oxohepta-3-ene-1,7-dioic acid hydratase in catechol pathway